MDRLTALPDNCIHNILSKTSPRDACKFSAISKPMKKVADSDDLWIEFFPSDYQPIVLRSATPGCLKPLYLRLSDSPILLDGANMSFALERETGKKCFTLGARNLKIVWGDDPDSWRWMSLRRSRFPEVARLLAVFWLEMTGRVNTRFLSPKTTYAAYLVYDLARGNYGLASLPMNGLVRFVGERGDDGAKTWPNTFYLKLKSSKRAQMPENGFLPQKRKNGWLEVEFGEIVNDHDNEREVEMQIWGYKDWKVEGFNQSNLKSGLIVEGFELRPKVDPRVN